MNRTYLRSRRVKPRSWESRSSRHEYMVTHKHCESCGSKACDPHHIAGRGWEGADHANNLLAVCRRCHDRLGRTIAGKVEGLWHKWRSGALDLDWYGMRPGYSVRGKLEGVWFDAAGPREQSMIREMLA